MKELCISTTGSKFNLNQQSYILCKEDILNAETKDANMQ